MLEVMCLFGLWNVVWNRCCCSLLLLVTYYLLYLVEKKGEEIRWKR